ncbi:ATP-binding protein [Pseudanabaena galeata UHCC 0370]|uniref:ATP-binding protein n=1 Tax=Pseudanabaena galeata UHCC 0370 TaxID=3110310 RepID=A0ABU5TQR7_9CYAN|nr:ATP-binding protein [Pseudanabaena galeata]MEA5480624.1 ATP-binding protein [Pseudanabaena galeata UHCC 0370]
MTEIASPSSTGGIGDNFESLVGAYYLAALLMQSVSRGQDSGITKEIRFQRLFDGDPLDDLIVISALPVGEAKLALQIKRDLTFGEKSEKFDKVILACWETLKSPHFNLGTDRFGIVLGLYSKNIDEYYQSVLTWARTSANSTDFLKRINQQRLANQTQRSFVKLIRDKLNSCLKSNVSDDDLWNFFRSMVILHFDFQKEGSRDYNYLVEIVSYSLEPNKKTDSSKLISELTNIADRSKYTAGSFNASGVRLELQQKFNLLPSPDCREDLSRLQRETKFALQDIRSDIGGLTLDRAGLVADILEMTKETSVIGLVGSSGSGKSALLKALAESQQGESFVIVLAWDRINSTGWSGFSNHLQLKQSLKDILIAASGSSQPIIFIDGIDRITDNGKCKVINDLLRTLSETPLSKDGSRRWIVIFSAREENLQNLSWIEWGDLGIPKTFPIPELTQPEIQYISDYHPRLKPLLNNEKLTTVAKNFFLLSLLIDPRLDINLATEIAVSRVWWQKSVGSFDGDLTLGTARQQALRKLGNQVVKSLGSRLIVDDTPPEVLISLEFDRILLRDTNRDVYRFSHDLLEDWVTYRVLDQHRERLPMYLQEIGQPLGLLRAVQLLGTFLLETYETDEPWRDLVEEIEEAKELSPKWRQALLTAPLRSPRADELLDKAKLLLIADDAKRLIELMVTLRTVEVLPNFSLPSLPDQVKNQLMPFFMSDPIPRWSVWQPFMGWMLKHLGDLPATIRPEFVKLMEIWQDKSPVGSIYRKNIGEIAFEWLEKEELRRS